MGYIFFKFYFLSTVHENISIWTLKLIPCIITLLILAMLSNNFNFRTLDIQSCKFPPTNTYLYWSLLSISLAVIYICRNSRSSKFEKNLKYIEFIGKNSIYFYFAQGISSSLLYYILPIVDVKIWFIRFIILAIFNIIFTLFLGFSMKKAIDAFIVIKK